MKAKPLCTQLTTEVVVPKQLLANKHFKTANRPLQDAMAIYCHVVLQRSGISGGTKQIGHDEFKIFVPARWLAMLRKTIGGHHLLRWQVQLP